MKAHPAAAAPASKHVPAVSVIFAEEPASSAGSDGGLFGSYAAPVPVSSIASKRNLFAGDEEDTPGVQLQRLHLALHAGLCVCYACE